MEDYVVFYIRGGLGKHVAATAVAKCITNNYVNRKLIVVCSYPEVFLNLPYVYRVYRDGMTPYFYDDFIRDKESIIFSHEPYYESNHINKKTNLIRTWCDLYKLKYSDESPDIILNLRQQQVGYGLWKRDKPIMVIQTNGGDLNDSNNIYSWARDMPYNTAMAIVDKFSSDYHIIQITKNKATALPNVECVYGALPNSDLFSLLLMSNKRVLIDSSLQHASAALNLPSTVLWIATDPKVFGYGLHRNISANLVNNMLPDSFLFDYSFVGIPHECPFINDNIFNIDQVISSILAN